MSTTLLEVAQSLQTSSVRGMADLLGLAAPISARELIRTFVQSSLPYDPIVTSPSGDSVPTSPVLIKWTDPGADSYRRAISFQVKLTELNPTYRDLLSFEQTNDSSLSYPNALDFGGEYEVGALAQNKYGQSPLPALWVKFQTVAKPSGSSGGPATRYVKLDEDQPYSAAGGNSTWMNYHSDVQGPGAISKVRNDTQYEVDLTHGTTINMKANTETNGFSGSQISGYWSAVIKGVQGPDAPGSIEFTVIVG